MLFHIFNSQQERREYGGSCFIEFQFCRLPMETPIKELVNSDVHWQNDSLYVDDENRFYTEYSKIFDCGIYNNLSSGTVDIYGLNYYSPNVTESIIEKLNDTKPLDYEVLLDWLNKSKEYNGFYILGI